ncbi:MAG: hypothetical protein ACRDOK_22725 [Streptosporangiaceae bacterium]
MTEPPAASENESLRERFERRKSEIRAMGDLAEAVRAAGRLGDEMAVFRSEAARLRSELAQQLRDEQGLSVRALGDKLRVSKATAQQILGKRPRGGSRMRELEDGQQPGS